MAENSRIDAVVCIPTFQRPQMLLQTLASLEAQTASLGWALVVIDNDAANPAGAEEARRFLARTGREGVVAIEAEQGNVYAINAAFDLARTRYPDAEYLLMIDDDEEAEPHWLERMVAAARGYNADIVGGPVERRFDDGVPDAIRHHPLFGSIEAPSGPVQIIHGTGNCLIRRRVFEQLDPPRLDPRFNFLGGGDMDFFTRSRAAGLRFAWAADALIHEHVPAGRASTRWLMARSLRTGTINYTIDRIRARSPLEVLLVLAKNVASVGLSLIRAAKVLAKTREPLSATHPILMSAGRMLASFGFSPVPYKAKTDGS